MFQEEFNELYDGLKVFAFKEASKYFKDNSLKIDAVDKAMDRLVDKYIENPKVTIFESRLIIRSSIGSSIGGRKLESIGLGYGWDGFNGYKVKSQIY